MIQNIQIHADAHAIWDAVHNLSSAQRMLLSPAQIAKILLPAIKFKYPGFKRTEKSHGLSAMHHAMVAHMKRKGLAAVLPASWTNGDTLWDSLFGHHVSSP